MILLRFAHYGRFKLYIYLYTNTVLDGSVILWFCLSVCLSVCLWFWSFAIETTFPLFNFKTKHIFGILMTLRKFLKLCPLKGAPQAHQICFFSFTAAEGGWDNFSFTAILPEGERNPAEGWCFASSANSATLTLRNLYVYRISRY